MTIWDEMEKLQRETAEEYQSFAKRAIAAIENDVRERIQEPDENGFVYLTNADKGSAAPRDFAIRFGFKQPVFEEREAVMPDNDFFQYSDHVSKEQVDENRAFLKRTCISWWVKEGLQ